MTLAAAALSWHGAFITEWVWIDLVCFLIFAVAHVVANASSPNLKNDAAGRETSFTFVNQLTAGGIAAVGIMLPLSLAAVGTFASNGIASRSILINIFVGDAWLSLSLLLGLHVLWMSGFRAHTENIQNLKAVRIPAGLQLGALALGVVRLLISAFLLVQTAS